MSNNQANSRLRALRIIFVEKTRRKRMETRARKFDFHRAWVASSVMLDAVLVLVSPLIAEEPTSQHAIRIRELRGRELQEARAASDAADQMRAAFESAYPWKPSDARSENASPASAAAQEEFAGVEAAYKEVMDKYAHTEIAAYCGLRLSGLYKYRRDTTRAVDQAKDTASQFAGTSYETNALFTVGLIYLQSLHDPRQAAEWFKKIPKPSAADIVGRDQYDEAEKLYLSAQQQIAKCELAMGRRAYADRRYERLASRYPQFRTAIEQTRTSQLRMAIERGAVFDLEAILDERIATDPLFDTRALQPAPVVVPLSNTPQLSPDHGDNETTTAAPVSLEPRPSPKTRLRWAGVGLASAGSGLSAFALFRCLYRRNAGKEHHHV